MFKIIESFLKDLVDQYAEIETENIDFLEEVRKSCELNHCGKYRKNWMCPPGIGSINDLKEKYTKYKKAFVFNKVTNLEDSFDIEGMDEGRKRVEDILNKLRVELKDYTNIQLLGVGSCNICKICTYPDSPCRYPKLAVPSLEAIGINVLKIANGCNLNYYNGINTVTYFGMVLYNLEK